MEPRVLLSGTRPDGAVISRDMPERPGSVPRFRHQNLLGIGQLDEWDVRVLLDLADEAIADAGRTTDDLAGRTQVNLFFEASTRTQASFEIAGKRLGMHVVNMAVDHSSVKKGETLLDTAATLNAMRPDILVVRHSSAGAVALLARRVDCCVINGGDGAHEHPTQALLDALTIRRRKGRIEGLTVAICGDIAHSRVARSNLILLGALGARLHLVGPTTLLPSGVAEMGADVFTDMDEGIRGADVVMMLRLQTERRAGIAIPSAREFHRRFGLTAERLSLAASDAIVMHPGPMNRGVEIASEIADGPRSVIAEQVEMGVAVRIAVIKALLTASDAAREPAS